MNLQYAAILLLMFSCNKSPEKNIHATGTVVASNTAEIKAEVTGKLRSIHFIDGQKVTEGDVLFNIESTPYEERLEIAVSRRLQNISKLQYAAEKVDRYQTLLVNNYVSENDCAQQISELTAYEGLVMQNDAEIRSAKNDLNNCAIRAPFTAIAGKHLIDTGNFVQNNDITLVHLNQIDPIYIDFTLTEKEYAKISTKKNLQILLTHPYNPNHTTKAKLIFIDNTIHQNKISLRLEAPNPEYKFFPGQSINIIISPI